MYLAERDTVTPVGSPEQLASAQARQWDPRWRLAGACDPRGTGLLIASSRKKAPGDPPLVLRMRPRDGRCALERQADLPERAVLEIAIAGGAPGSQARIRALADGHDLNGPDTAAPTGQWRVYQWPVDRAAGTPVTLRLEAFGADGSPPDLSWAFARVVSASRADATRPSLDFAVPEVDTGSR
jgi:hypothetical protein